jgi:hypothetical protein
MGDFKQAFQYLGRLQKLTGKVDQRHTAQVVALMVRYAGMINGYPDTCLWHDICLLQEQWESELIDPFTVGQVMALVSRFPPSEKKERLLAAGKQLTTEPSLSSQAVREWVSLLDIVMRE